MIIQIKGSKITVLVYFQDFCGFEPQSEHNYFSSIGLFKCLTVSLVEITAFRLESKSVKDFFEKKNPPMRALGFLTGHMIYNLAYT